MFPAPNAGRGYRGRGRGAGPAEPGGRGRRAAGPEREGFGRAGDGAEGRGGGQGHGLPRGHRGRGHPRGSLGRGVHRRSDSISLRELRTLCDPDSTPTNLITALGNQCCRLVALFAVNVDSYELEMVVAALGSFCDKGGVTMHPESFVDIVKILESKNVFKKVDEIFLYLSKSGSQVKEGPTQAQRMERFLLSVSRIVQEMLVILPAFACNALGKDFFATIQHLLGLSSVAALKLPESCLKSLREAETRLKEDFQTRVAVNPDPETAKNPDFLQLEAQSELVAHQKPPESFRRLSIIPESEDVCVDMQPFLRPNITKYPDAETYLDIHFRLLREDFFYPLRAGIKAYRELKMKRQLRFKADNMRLYYKVKFGDIRGLEGKMELVFPVDGSKRIDWTTSKRLMFGSLLCLSSDDFQTIMLFTVAERDPVKLSKGKIIVRSEGISLPMDATKKEYVMAESPVYFEAYRGVLEALQKISAPSFPMAPFILGQVDQATEPGYLKKALEETGEVRYNLEPILEPLATGSKAETGDPGSVVTVASAGQKLKLSKVNLADPDFWPSPEDLNLDPSQSAALRAALTRNVALIQGPPGTGKTYVGLRIVQILLHNRKFWWNPLNRVPILVVCCTNHALDQFLEGILKYTKSIVRVGSQSKCESLKPYSLAECRKKSYQSRSIPKDLYRYKQEVSFVMKENLQRVEELKRSIHGIQHYGIIDEDTLFSQGIMQESFRNKLILTRNRNLASSALRQWLCVDSDEQLTHLLHYLGQNHVVRVLQRPVFVDPAAEPKAEAGNDVPAEENEGWDPEDIKEAEAERMMDDDRPVNLDLENAEPRNDLEVAVNLNIKFCFKTSEFFHETNQLKDRLNEIAHELESDEADVPSLLEEREFVGFRINQLERHEWLVGEILKICSKFPPVRQEDLERLEALEDFSRAPLHQRWIFYEHWRRGLQGLLENKLREVEDRCERNHRELKNVESAADAFLCRDSMVVGMTTAGAAKQRALLEHLKPKIVVVEEAAEVLEAHITTALSSCCEHLILIGDHQQLRPSTAVYHLARKFRLEISMFERLINCGFQASVLGVQHRMQPEIAQLIVPSIYEKLENHPSVFSFPEIRGMEHSVFFLTHNQHEKQDNERQSHLNPYEADMALSLASHLILQGYSAEDITILTTYTGQLLHMKKLRRSQYSLIQGVRICVVDNFQGEENNIIILSLVRSNEDENIGFLKIENRICVALSRAKHGFYLLGNMGILGDRSKLWGSIRNTLDSQRRLGSTLVLRCQIHGGVTEVKDRVDFPPDGGCRKLCKTVMPCGHVCPRVCHTEDRSHTEYRCQEKCTKECKDGHPCPKRCFRDCNPCLAEIERILPCRHAQIMECHEDPDKEYCRTKVFRCLPVCEHNVEMDCGEEIDKVPCPFPCDMNLDCGHECPRKCHKRSSHDKVRCQKPCERTPCPERHRCPKKCFEDCGNCKQKVLKTLPCGHQAELECYLPVEQAYCRIKLEKNLPNCSHTAVLECSEPPDKVQCQKECGKILCDEEHVCRKRCHEKCGPCPAKVERILPCGHTTKMPCSLNPADYKCKVKLHKKLEFCGHEVEMACSADPEKSACPKPCDVRMDCGHTCTRSCHVNDDPDHLNYECRKPCPRNKAGCRRDHKCEKKCVDTCDPCNVRVKIDLPCGHKTTNLCSIDPATIHCGVETVKKIPECGHSIRIDCSTIPTRMMCESPCESKLQCSHVCGKKCREQCDPKDCEAIVEIDETLSCGHKILMKCNLAQQRFSSAPADIPKWNLLPDCLAPCKEILACEHRCRGNCGDCFNGRVHIPCEQDCGRTLVCGHQCEVKCAAACPPCSKKCENRCVHSHCSICRNLTTPQCCPADGLHIFKSQKKEPCTWRCAHYRCSRRCGESCDRPACEEPCKLQLKCGHPCIGLCGEICPPLCRICNQEQLLEFILFGFEEDEDSRFIFLPDCGHTIEVKAMDHWILMNQESGGEILMKRCPRCQTIIRTCLRYKNQLMKSYDDIALVKNRILGARIGYKELIQKLRLQVSTTGIKLSRIGNLSKSISSLGLLARGLEQLEKILQDRVSKKPRAKPVPPNLDPEERYLVQVKVQLMDELAKLVSRIVLKETNQHELKPKLMEDLDKRCTRLIRALEIRTRRITEKDYQSLHDEIQRLELILAFYRIQSSHHFPQGSTLSSYQDLKQSYDEIHSLLMENVQPLTSQQRVELTNHLKSMADRLKTGLGVTETEKMNIVKAIGMTPGHWFKCPNGHIYVITECGGAMQISKRNECGAQIGGESHRLLGDNSHAPEMDGSRFPAWSEGNNMANFRF